MVERIGIKKVKGGKLIKVRVEEEGGIIKEVKISGDFFVHPEDAIEEIEKALKGVHLSKVREALRDFAMRKTVRTVGFALDDIADVIEGRSDGV
ncbi:MAG: lipoate protein ligase C-terminal domain-containing protein [Candidatus Methanomethyliaceae archaeon]